MQFTDEFRYPFYGGIDCFYFVILLIITDFPPVNKGVSNSPA